MPHSSSPAENPYQQLGEVFEKLAGGLLILVVIAAPWYGGAPSDFEWAWNALAGGMAGSFVCSVLSAACRKQVPDFPMRFVIPVIFLLLCLLWWMTQDELAYFSSFRAEQMDYLMKQGPHRFLLQPRMDRLWFQVALLFGAASALYLGHSVLFRRLLVCAIGWSGFAVALYSLGEHFLHLPSPVWSLMVGKPVSTYVSFFHYSAVAACVNLAWPNLIFGRKILESRSVMIDVAIKVVVVAVCGLALAMWQAAAAQAVGVALLVTGGIWWLLARYHKVGSKMVRAALLGCFLLLGIGQYAMTRSSVQRYPEGWVSVEEARKHSPELSAELGEIARKRGDRFVPSEAPPRERSWVAAGRMAADYPLIGPGPGAWLKLSDLYSYDPFVQSFFLHLQFVHHDILQLAAEWGGLPTLATLWLWGFAFWSLSRSGQGGGIGRAGITLALFGVAVHGLVDFPLQVPGLKIWAMLLIGVACTPLGQLKKNHSHRHHRKRDSQPV